MKKGVQVSLFNRIKITFKNVIKSRGFVLIIAFCILFSTLIYRVFDLQIVNGQNYLEDYKLLIQKKKELKGTRGRIYDRNGNVLADNKLAYAVTIEDDGSFDAETRAEKNDVINETILNVIDIVESNGDSIVNDFSILVNSNGEYEFAMSEGTRRQRFIADVYGKRTIDELSAKQKNATAQDIMDFLCEDEKSGYNIDQKKYDKATVVKLTTIRYAMHLNSYQKYIPVTIATDIKDVTVAAIEEHLDTLYGIDIAEDSVRTYPDGMYFAPLLGYTGKISQSEYETLSEEKNSNYSLTDIVGKAGIEQSMDQYLQGTKGEETVYVDNVGKVVESQKISAAKAGNDLYLSIDKNLQIAAYRVIEEKLAGILLSKIQNIMNYTPDPESDSKNVIIPIDDVYFALINNSILDMDHVALAEAGANEQAIYGAFQIRLEQSLAELSAQLSNPQAPVYSELSKEMQAYMNYIATTLLTTNIGIIQKDKIDTNDEMYKAWMEDESINLYTYLNHAISKNWIDTSVLQNYMSTDAKYSDASEIYQAILTFTLDHLKTDDAFAKLVYRYMIKDGTISGTELSLALFEQNVLARDEASINGLLDGSLSSYDFIRAKIQSLELTPGSLGLEPCTGSIVMTDVNTGSTLACVSYPGYDNNRLANTMDTAYYYELQTSSSRPFYNKATQERTAPGSTFKMVSSAAGLTEGIIDGSTKINCSGVYTKVTPSPKCWIYSGAHGSIGVERAIDVSCNCYFYEVGHLLGETVSYNTETKENETSYSDSLGVNKLASYAAEFGLDKKSGLEIPESEPNISDTDAVRSAIGQGTNIYTVSQLARYVTAVASRGNVYSLSLLDHTQDLDGNVIETFTPELLTKMENISSTSWNLIQDGMADMVRNSSTFSDMRSLKFEMSGKTGTAQQSTTHADHALFVGYAPSVNPEIALAVRIANGYSSSYAAEIGRDVVKYYYRLVDESSLIHNQAAELGAAIAGD